MMTPLPTEFMATMRQALGAEAEELFAALDTESITSIRLNPAKPAPTFDGDRVGWCEWGRYLNERPQFTLDPLLHAGAYYVQEAASQFVAHLLNGVDLKGRRILDMCAAPGGKSTIYSSLVGDNGLVVANDISRSRALALADNVQRWGMGNVIVTCNEPRHIGDFENWFDVVAVDAPCSGEGMFRKMEEARNEWSPSAVNECAARQREIVAEAWRALRPGGILIYSTCTFNPSEDEGTVSWMNEAFSDELESFEPIELLPEWGIISNSIGAFQCFHFYPHKAKGEGLYAAIARKCEGKQTRTTPKARRKVFSPLQKSDIKEVANWINPEYDIEFRMVGDTIYGYNKEVVNDVTHLSEVLNVLYSGVAMGQIFKGRLKPEHSLALFVGYNENATHSTEVELDVALNYLRRHDIDASLFADGINRVMYKGVAIGFVKRIGQRCNNMYPKELRILNL